MIQVPIQIPELSTKDVQNYFTGGHITHALIRGLYHFWYSEAGLLSSIPCLISLYCSFPESVSWLIKEFTDYRRDIIDGILKDESKIEPSQLPSLKSMYTADQAKIWIPYI